MNLSNGLFLAGVLFVAGGFLLLAISAAVAFMHKRKPKGLTTLATILGLLGGLLLVATAVILAIGG